MSNDRGKFIAGQERVKCLMEIMEEVQVDSSVCFSTDRLPAESMEQFWDDFMSAHALLKECYERVCTLTES